VLKGKEKNKTDRIRAGLLQLNTRDNTEDAFSVIEELTEECVESGGADVVVLPELSTYLSEKDSSSAAETMDGSVITRFRKLARKHGIYLHNGSFIEKSGTEGKNYNTSVLINPEGEIEAVYRKIHLFDIELDGGLSYRESSRYLRGERVVVRKTACGVFGFSICYDLRFPDLYRRLAIEGAELIFVPAAFTLFTGKDHWEALLRARAIENQVYIAAPDQIGTHPEDKVCYGNSMIIDPWGKVIARASDRVGYITADIDLNYLREIRTKLPSLKNRVDLSGYSVSTGL